MNSTKRSLNAQGINKVKEISKLKIWKTFQISENKTVLVLLIILIIMFSSFSNSLRVFKKIENYDKFVNIKKSQNSLNLENDLAKHKSREKLKFVYQKNTNLNKNRFKLKSQESDDITELSKIHILDFYLQDLIKSKEDSKNYYTFKLSSGLEVIVVYDEKSNLSAAGMTINAGYNKEDPDVRGLAHFCEHLLFLGSKKYPEPTAFFDFVTTNHGKFNGFTDFEGTAFFFQISHEKFEEGLDMFANNFISPLFSEKFIEKEVMSINSEYEKNLQNDSKRKDSVLRYITNEKSLFHRFTTGNLKTLSEDPKNANVDIKQRIQNYFVRNYRPDTMKLIIYGNQPVEEYHQMAQNIFSEMNPPGPDQTIYSTDPNQLPFEYNSIGKFVFYQTLNNHQDFEINIMIDDVYAMMPNNPILFFNTLFNFRGEHSLHDIFRKKGFMKGISSKLKKAYKGVSFLKIQGHITEDGIKNMDIVISLIYAYINKLKLLGQDEKLYEYIRQSYDIAFDYKAGKKKHIIDFIKKLSRSVWQYDKNYIMSQHKILSSYNKEAILKFCDRLTLKNSVIFLGNNLFDKSLIQNYQKFLEDFPTEISDGQAIFKATSDFYNVKHSEFNIKKEFIDIVEDLEKNPVALELSQNLPSFTQMIHLPKEQISLEKTCKKKIKNCKKKYKKDAKDLTPEVLLQDTHRELYYKEDKSFFVAKTNFFLKFIFPGIVTEPNHATLIRLFVYAINHSLSNTLFMQALNQNSFKIKGNVNGFIFEIYSFTETITNTSQIIFQNLRNLKINENEFNLIKDEMKQQLRAHLNLVPSAKAYFDFLSLVSQDFVDSETIIHHLDKITINDFNNFYNNLYSVVYFRGLIHGTMSKEDASNLFMIVTNMFLTNTTGVIDQNSKYHIERHVNFSGYYIFREKMEDTRNVIHAVANFYQIGENNLHNLIYTNLIKNLCGNIYFSELRTKQQLGYVAKGKIVEEGDRIYFLIFVQGSVKTPDLMDHHIEDVIEKMKGIIESVDESKFEKTLRHVIKHVGKKDPSFKARTNHLWNEINSGRNYFNLKEMAMNEEDIIDEHSLFEFFHEKFYENLKKISIQVYSSGSNITNGVIKSIREKYQPILIEHLNYFRSSGNNFKNNKKMRR